MVELRQTKEYARYMELIGWRVERVSGVYCYSKKIPIIGSFVKVQRPAKKLKEDEIKQVVAETRGFVAAVEPLIKTHIGYYESLGFKKINSPSLPSKTLVFDLKKSEQELLSDMHHKTRYNTRLAERKGVKVKKSDDIGKFSEFWQKSAKKRRMFLSMRKEIESIHEAFGKKCQLLFAYRNKRLLGAVMTLSTRNRAHYMYAASSAYGNSQFAPTFLVWEAIKYAKAKNLKEFDFEGIYDKRFPIDSWKGFSRFKMGFGGKEVEYPYPVRKFFFPLGMSNG